MGFEPTASLVLSQGGLPFAYRAVVDLHQYPEQESNLQTSGFKPDRSADWRTWASPKVVLEGLEPTIVSL